jgi:hypothetical protein
VLEPVRGGAFDDLRQRAGTLYGFAIDRHVAQGRRERRRGREREAADRHAVTRAQQHDAADRVASGSQARECICGDRAGVNVSGMRNDQCLGTAGGVCRRIRRRQVRAHVGGELPGRAGVEHASHCGWSYLLHRATRES